MFVSNRRYVIASLIAVTLIALAALIVPYPVSGEPVQTIAPVAEPSVQASVEVPAKVECPTRKDHRQLLRKTVRYSSASGDYHARPLSEGRTHKLAMMRKCQKEHGSRSVVKQMRADYDKRIRAWRFHRYIDHITPYGKWAIPSYIVFRESRYNRCAKNPNSTAGGYYQFLYSTWRAYGGGSHGAACAPDWEQHQVAHRAWAGGSGSSHWALTR